MLKSLAILPVLALSQVTATQDPFQTPDPVALLSAAREACLELGSVAYQARYEEFGERHAAGVTICEVRLARPDPERGLPPRFHVLGTRSFRDRTAPLELQAGFDGETVRRLRAGSHQVVERRFDGLAPGQQAWTIAAGELGAGGNGAVLWELVAAEPLRRELANTKVEYEGRTAVGGVLCDVLYFPGETPQSGDRLFLSVDDHLPRKREHIGVMYTDRIYGSLLTVTDLKVNRELSDADFGVPVPAGYDLVPYEDPVRGEALLALGSMAPDWTLRDPQGVEHRLADYRGEVVVLDFWGTWCGPCVRKLPGLQELADALREKPVEVLALSSHEPPNAKPRELMDRRGCHIPLLLHGETICDAYGVTTFPTVYVIGVDGIILFRAIGGAPPGDLEVLILQHLQGRDR